MDLKWVWAGVMMALLKGWWCLGCLEQERSALLQLKSFFDSPLTLQNWEEDSLDCCQWERVECNDSTGRVTQLFLNKSRADSSGEWYLNTSLFIPFKELKSLYLKRNYIRGFVGNNEGFERLHTSMSSLEVLDLSSNLFNESILSSLGEFPHLKSLNLGLNQFVEPIIPSGLCELIHIQELDISNNDLQGTLPRCLANLSSLKKLDLSSNRFSGDISLSPLAKLTSIQELKLSNNHFQIPLSLGPFWNHSKLKCVYGQNNTIYFKTELQSVAPKFQLHKILLSGCADCGVFPNFLSRQRNLQVVDLSSLNLKGEFPNWLLTNNTRLEILFLVNNSLSGRLQLPVHPHLHLLALDVSCNSFSDRIPFEVGTHLTRLKLLNMSTNGFDGVIPASLGNLGSLQILDLSNNELSGGIPEQLAMHCFSVHTLILSNNGLQGKIFSRNFNLTNLWALQLDGNQFTGTIPEVLLNSSLSTLDVSYNNLSGRIPGWMGDMPYLQNLVMSNNHLDGPIPENICNLVYLEVLDLAKNDISGKLPSCFSLSLRHIRLSENRLEGSLPDSLVNAGFLVTLDLGSNHLSGSIPSWIGDYSTFYLILRNNKFEGEIPSQLCKLDLFSSLIDLSHNNLSGQIPSCFGNPYRDPNISSSPPDNLPLGQQDPSISAPPPYDLPLNRPHKPPSLPSKEPIEFTTKSFTYSYQGRILSYMSGIDLSNNNLTGNIPPGIGNLFSIHTLNLSHNSLVGPIPPTFGNLKQIESLDLSHNNLNGEIPPGLVKLNSLAVFKVGYNNLSGRTPDWTAQFATFEESAYEGNPFLCGLPLKSCTETGSSSSQMPQNIGFLDMDAFKVSFMIAYVTVLLVIVSVLYINPSWRDVWFDLVEACITSCGYSL